MSEITDPNSLATYWKQQIELWKHSGESQARFCQANDLTYHRFGYWRRKFEAAAQGRDAKQGGGGFAAVDCRPDIDSGLTLSLPNGLVLRGICADNVSVVHQLLDRL